MTRLAVDDSGHPIQMIGQGARQLVAIDATVGGKRCSNAFASTTNAVEIVATSDCWYLFGDSSVTVSASPGANLGTYLPAGAIKYQRVEKLAHNSSNILTADTHIAVIQDSAPGTLCITEGR